MICPSGKIKRSNLWQHFSAKESAPNKATCNHGSMELSRGKEGHKSLGNKTLNTHLKIQHAETFKEYEVATNSVGVERKKTCLSVPSSPRLALTP